MTRIIWHGTIHVCLHAFKSRSSSGTETYKALHVIISVSLGGLELLHMCAHSSMHVQRSQHCFQRRDLASPPTPCDVLRLERRCPEELGELEGLGKHAVTEHKKEHTACCQHSGTVNKGLQICTGLTNVGITVLVILNIVAFATYAVFIELWIYLHQNIVNVLIKEKTLLVLGMFPVTAIAYQLGMFVPRAGTLVDFVAAVYASISLFGFFHLTINYLGGVTEAIDKLQYVDSPLNVGPCCCCCICLPKVRINRKAYRILRIGILQTLILLPLLQFISAVLWANGKYNSGEVHPTNPLFYIKILMNISALLSLYVFNLLLKAAFGIAEAGYHLVAKYAIIITYTILDNLQPLILDCLATYNVIPCVGLYSSKGRATQIDQHLKILEMFILLLVSRKYYRKRLPESTPLYFENPLHNMP
uniref:organic solute transporter subunit alpha-like n=1 Tax=Pristiophorus japonicus TaxID=55135 RepID=UPI00398E5449